MPSASRPEFFVDRSLGRRVVPTALREAGAVVHVMADVYGERIGQGLVVIDFGLRAFCLTNANLRGVELAERLVEHLPRIVRVASEQPGPYIYGVYSDGVRPLWPK